MGYTFVSYGRKDLRKVMNIVGNLEEDGFEFWQDTNNIRNGTYWPEEITKAIIGCTRFLLFMSSASMASNNVMREVQIAFENKKKIIILKLDSSEIPKNMSYQLIGIQHTLYQSPDWRSRITAELSQGKKQFPTKPRTPITKLPNDSKTSPRRSHKAIVVITEIEREFSTNRVFYKDQCHAALSKLDELLQVVGNHWVSPTYTFTEFVPRVYLIEKIEFIKNLIYEFSDTCPPGSLAKKEIIQNELRILFQELNRKANK